ncbi:MAG: hypothetical protein LBE09_08345 [Christensenellaceae bacterium]|nr:hypothetical protein [Christensenellaceae bacterium]
MAKGKNARQIPINKAVAGTLYNFRNGNPNPKWSEKSDSDHFVLRSVTKDKAVVWNVADAKMQCGDLIEISGTKASATIAYGKKQTGQFKLNRHVSFPMLRNKPNVIGCNYRFTFGAGIKMYLEDTKIAGEVLLSSKFKGTLAFECDFMNGGALIVRTLSPSLSYPALIEKIEVVNKSKDTAVFTADESTRIKRVKISDTETINVHSRLANANGDFRSDTMVSVKKKLVPGASATCYVIHYAFKNDESLNFNAEREIRERLKLADQFLKQTQTYIDPLTDSFFSLCLFRGCETIFNTKNGLLHYSTATLNYSVALAIEQCEIINPIFPLINYAIGIKQSLNCFKLFADCIIKDDKLPDAVAGDTLKTIELEKSSCLESFVAGLSRFLLALGQSEACQEFIVALEMAFDKLKTKYLTLIKTSIKDNNAFDLASACSGYDAALHIGYLMDSLDNDSSECFALAESIKQLVIGYLSVVTSQSTNREFSNAGVVLDLQLFLPATVGITEMSQTIFKLIFNDKVKFATNLKDDEMGCPESEESKLLAFKGAFMADVGDACDVYKRYVASRMLGMRSPYPRTNGYYQHGSSSSDAILSARVIIDGIFGVDPISFTTLRIKPKLKAKLTGLHFAGTDFDIDNSDELKVRIGTKTYPSQGCTDFNFDTLTWK